MRRVLLVALWMLASLVRAAPTDVNADIIWDDNDAKGKCPALCEAKHLYWMGTWRKVGWMDQPVCACDSERPPQPAVPPVSVSISIPGAGMNALPPGAVTRYDRADFPGNDLRDQPAASFEQCAAVCLGSVDCNAFTFNDRLRNCYLKRGAGAPAYAGDASSGIVNRQGAPVGAAPPVAAGASCSVGGTAKCPGCSVACGPNQRAVCDHAVEGVGSTCAKNTSCRCE
ncbi:MAG: hypothetical protein JSR18_11820 [Proteobacteria bacterium]|nr:hypothetical protein [Pseudomonadota bacterium]